VNRLNYEQSLRVTENALAVLLGDYPGSQKLFQQATIPAAPPQLPVGLPADLLRNRPDIRAALLRVEAKDADVAAAIADRFPNFNLNGTYGVSRSNLTGSLITGDFWSLLLKLSQPVLDGGRRKAEVARNQAQFAELVAGYQQTVLRGFQEVEDALSGNRTGAAKILRLQEQEEASAAAQRLTLDRYMNGLDNYLPVLSSQIFNFNAQSQLLAAQRQLLSQRISLARALGGNWMAEQLNTAQQQLAEKGTEK
jgi:outer membrane protein TolC